MAAAALLLLARSRAAAAATTAAAAAVAARGGSRASLHCSALAAQRAVGEGRAARAAARHESDRRERPRERSRPRRHDTPPPTAPGPPAAPTRPTRPAAAAAAASSSAARQPAAQKHRAAAPRHTATETYRQLVRRGGALSEGEAAAMLQRLETEMNVAPAPPAEGVRGSGRRAATASDDDDNDDFMFSAAPARGWRQPAAARTNAAAAAAAAEAPTARDMVDAAIASAGLDFDDALRAEARRREARRAGGGLTLEDGGAAVARARLQDAFDCDNSGGGGDDVVDVVGAPHALPSGHPSMPPPREVEGHDSGSGDDGAAAAAAAAAEANALFAFSGGESADEALAPALAPRAAPLSPSPPAPAALSTAAVLQLSPDDPLVRLIDAQRDPATRRAMAALPTELPTPAAAEPLQAARAAAAALLAALEDARRAGGGAGARSGAGDGSDGDAPPRLALEDLDALRGVSLPPEQFPGAARGVAAPADLSSLPSYPAARTVAAVAALRARSDAVQLQAALASAVRLLPPAARPPVMERLAAAAAAGRLQLQLAPLPGAAAAAAAPTTTTSSSGGGSGSVRPRRPAAGDAVDSVEHAATAAAAARDPDDADGIADLRRELGFEPRGVPAAKEAAPGKGGPKARAVAAAAEHAAHVAKLHELRNDPAALAAYLIAEGERAAAGDVGVAEPGAPAGAVARTSLVPAGYRNWAEVAAHLSANPKRAARAAAAARAESTVKLRQSIKPVREAREPSRRQVRVAANITRVLTATLARRAVPDADLYPRGMPIEIAEVSVTPDLRRAYVRWMLPFPVRNLAAEAAAAAGGPQYGGGASLAGLAATLAAPHAPDRLPLNMAGLAVRRSGRAAAAAAMAPVSATSAMLMASLASRNARDRGMAQIDTPASPDAQAALRLRAPRKRSAAAVAAEVYGDDGEVEHLDAAAAAAVGSVTAALARNSGALKRAVGFELGMQFMPTLEFHRYVAAEVGEAAAALLARRLPPRRAAGSN